MLTLILSDAVEFFARYLCNTLVMYFAGSVCLFSCKSFTQLSKANLRANCLLIYHIILLYGTRVVWFTAKSHYKKNESFCANDL